MRGATVLWITTAVTTPFAVGALFEGPGGESELWAKAEEIARREFHANASLVVQEVRVSFARPGAFGETLEPDFGYAFHHARVALTNTGKMDIAPSTWQFSALDERGHDHAALLGGAHHDFDASRLRKGATRSGEVVFELPAGARLAGIAWQGDFANATGSAPPARR